MLSSLFLPLTTLTTSLKSAFLRFRSFYVDPNPTTTEINVIRKDRNSVSATPFSPSDLDDLPGHLPLFEKGSIAVWRHEVVRILSDAIMYGDCYFYDVKMARSGQLVLGVCEQNLRSIKGWSLDQLKQELAQAS